jgi:hypothetical protein
MKAAVRGTNTDAESVLAGIGVKVFNADAESAGEEDLVLINQRSRSLMFRQSEMAKA